MFLKIRKSRNYRKYKVLSQIKINIPVYDENDLPNDLKKITAVKPGSRNLAE